MAADRTPDRDRETGLRLFLAFPLPSSFRELVRGLQSRLRQHGIRGRWTPVENLHLTVLFLGRQPSGHIPALQASLLESVGACSAFDLEYEAVAAFSRKPRLLFVRLADRDGHYGEFCQAVRDAVAAAGVAVPPDVLRKPPVPHITIVRFRDPRAARDLRPHIAPDIGAVELPGLVPSAPEQGVLPCRELHLFRSDLTPQGPRYTSLKTFPLG